MKKILATAALLALGMTAAQAQTPQPADWTILTLTANTNKPADITWDRIGGHDWCGILRFLDRLKGCTINSGTTPMPSPTRPSSITAPWGLSRWMLPIPRSSTP